VALIGYARVSTLDHEPSLQEDALEAAGCEWTVGDRVSWALGERAARVRAPGITLVVWRLDRLGRSLRTRRDRHRARATQAAFRSLSDSIDTTTRGGRLVFHVFAALAAFERDLIREHTQAGLRPPARAGAAGGRPPVMSAETLAVARSMYDSREHTTAKIAGGAWG
jgi:DNA invertase Pin-like site-specific DNA recombinase